MSPIYDLRCKKCRAIFRDQVLTMKTDVDLEICYECGNVGMEKMAVRSTFQLRNGTCGGFTNSRGTVVGCDKAPGPNIDKK